jgi:hypothetical protein
MKTRVLARYVMSAMFAGCAWVSTTQAVTYYVATNGNDANAGTNWATAKATIQVGINVANNGDSVLVGQGTYALTNTINIAKGVNLISAYGDKVTIIDGQNSRACIYMAYSNALLRGFTITKGCAFSPKSGPGGITMFGGCMRDCTVKQNRGVSYGGGAYIAGGVVQDCAIISNIVTRYPSSGDARGGGAYLRDGAIHNSTIIGNIAEGESSDGGKGGGVYAEYGGMVRNCRIEGNIAYVPEYPVKGLGGGIYAQSSSTTVISIFNCVIVRNSAEEFAGGGYLGGGSRIFNCVISGNTSSGVNDELAMQSSSLELNIVANSVVYPGKVNADRGSVVSYNFTNNPYFVSANDFHLQSNSPCINAGSAVYATASDMDGVDRDHRPDIGAYEYNRTNPNFAAGGYAHGSTPPDIAILSVSNRFRSNLVDIQYSVTDSDRSLVEVRGYATTKPLSGPIVNYWDTIYPLVTLAEGTDSDYGAGVVPTNSAKLLVWDAGSDIGKSVPGLNVQLMASDSAILPISLHFVTVPADTNGPAFQINRYAGATSNFQLQRTLIWSLLKGMARKDNTNLIAVGGAYNDQVIAEEGVLTSAGKGWLVENLAGVRLATAAEIKRAREASTPGKVTKWPSYYRGEMMVNEYSIDTTDDNAWFLVKQ